MQNAKLKVQNANFIQSKPVWDSFGPSRASQRASAQRAKPTSAEGNALGPNAPWTLRSERASQRHAASVALDVRLEKF
jgi:hypothetical protein